MAIGQAVRLVVRPELITLRPPTESGFRGAVLSRTFLGEKAEYRVGVGDQVLQITEYTRPHATAFKAGDEVTLVLPTDGVHVLPD